MIRWEERYARVIADGGHKQFFDRFLDAVDVTALVVVSPWISCDGEMKDQFEALTHKIRKEAILSTVVLREPRHEPSNTKPVELLRQLNSVDLYFNRELHAKVYVCRCSPYGFAYVGSANLTGRATVAYEVGVMIDGRGAGEQIVDELQTLGTVDLLGRAGTWRADKNELFGGG